MGKKALNIVCFIKSQYEDLCLQVFFGGLGEGMDFLFTLSIYCIVS